MTIRNWALGKIILIKAGRIVKRSMTPKKLADIAEFAFYAIDSE